MGQVTEAIRLSRDSRVNLVIFNRRCFSSYAHDGYPAWTWRPYRGENPHEKHAHIEVNDTHHDVTRPWRIGMNPSDEKALINRVNAMIDMAPVNPHGDSLKPEENKLAAQLVAMAAGIEALGAAFAQVTEMLIAVGSTMTAILERLEGLKAGAAQEYTGVATVTLNVGNVDTLVSDHGRGGQ